MALHLVVAHQTAASPLLLDALREIASNDQEAEFVLLVPATPVSHLLTWTEGESETVAQATAFEGARAIRLAGLSLCDVVVGNANPLQAILDEHESRGRPYATTVVSTLPLGVSRWLRRDLPNRLRKLGLQVVHVVSPRTAPSQAVA